MGTPLDPESAAAKKLEDIAAVTDAALMQLDAEDFLVELLDRVKAILEADTAAVLILDRQARQLIATAASGLEEEVRQGVRIPVGRGFAGRIAAEQQPVILDHVDHTTVLNPILLARGIRSLMGVPMIAGGLVLGVMHIGSLGTRKFTEDDASLLQLAADRAAVAVQSVMSRSDREAAAALQRSLVPSAPPAIPGVAMAARYVPGSAVVGGDWYDVFPLPSGDVGVVIGDVAGSGLKAAVVMGRMRSVIRAYALETANPAAVMQRLDRKFEHFEPGIIATILYAVFSRDLTTVRLSSAGHLPPVMAVPGEATALADVPSDLLIGVTSNAPRRVTTLPFPPGALLCFYTDGLVERRDSPLDDGLSKLCKAVTAESPDAACVSIMGGLVGNESPGDDIALLAIRREPAA